MTDALSVEIIRGLQLILIVGAWGAFASWIAWKSDFFHLPKRGTYSGRVTFLDMLGAFVAFLTAEVIAVPVLFYTWGAIQEKKWVISSDLDAQSQGLINLAAIICSAVFIGIYCFFSSSRVLTAVFGENFWVSLKRSMDDFFLGVASWLVVYPLVGLASQIFSLFMLLVYEGPSTDQVAVKHLKDVMEFPWLFWGSVILIVSLVPILEEILFRGFLQMWLTRILGVVPAILLTALIFAFFHFSISQGVDNVELIISLFVLGCFLSFLRERQRSLWASIGLHAAFNAISIVMITSSAGLE